MTDHAAVLADMLDACAPIGDGPWTHADCRRYALALVAGLRGLDEPSRVNVAADLIYYLAAKGRVQAEPEVIFNHGIAKMGDCYAPSRSGRWRCGNAAGHHGDHESYDVGSDGRIGVVARWPK